MFHKFRKRKALLGGFALLIVGAGFIFMFYPPGKFQNAALFGQAWKRAFGISSNDELAVDLSLGLDTPLPPTSSQAEQENGSLESLPPLLIDSKSTPEPEKTRPPAALTVSPASRSAGDASSTQAAAAAEGQALPSATPRTPLAVRWCDFGSDTSAAYPVRLSEIAWMGSARSPNDEWLELENTSTEAVEVGGWQVVNQSGSIKINLESGTSIAGGGFLMLVRTAAADIVPADVEYSGALSNSGDHLKIFNDACGVVDEIDASQDGWPGGNNGTKQTLERAANGDGWQTSANVNGSPRAKNGVAATPTSTPTPSPTTTPSPSSTQSIIRECPATSTSDGDATVATTSLPETPPPQPTLPPIPGPEHLVIAAVRISGGSGASAEDYVKILNPTSHAVDISGWKLRKRTKTGNETSIKVFSAGSVVPSGGYFLWANSENGFANGLGAQSSSKQNFAGDNSVALLDGDDSMVDAVAWGEGHVNPYQEGGAYPQNPGPGQDLSRRFKAEVPVDTDNNSADFEILGP